MWKPTNGRRRPLVAAALSTLLAAFACSGKVKSSRADPDSSAPDACGTPCRQGSPLRDGGAGGHGQGGSAGIAGNGGNATQEPLDAAPARTPGYVACPSVPPNTSPERCELAKHDFCCHYMSPGYSLPLSGCNKERPATEPCFASEYCDDDDDCAPGLACVMTGALIRACAAPPSDTGHSGRDATDAEPPSSDASTAD